MKKPAKQPPTEGIETAVAAAVATVLEIMLDPTTPPEIKLHAAEIVLDRCMDFMATGDPDFMPRVAEVKARLKAVEQSPAHNLKPS